MLVMMQERKSKMFAMLWWRWQGMDRHGNGIWNRGSPKIWVAATQMTDTEELRVSDGTFDVGEMR